MEMFDEKFNKLDRKIKGVWVEMCILKYIYFLKC